MDMIWEMLGDTERENWLSHILKMDEVMGADGMKRWPGAETLTWEIWKERCHAVYNGDVSRPERAIKVAQSLVEE